MHFFKNLLLYCIFSFFQVAHSWETMLAACTDEKQAEKLKKMIGLRGDQASTSAESHHDEAKDIRQTPAEAKRQEEIARNLQQQYEMARMSTHTHRGMGLGFSSHLYAFPDSAILEQPPSTVSDKTKPIS